MSTEYSYFRTTIAERYSLDKLIQSIIPIPEEDTNSYKDALRYINCETVNDFIRLIDLDIKSD